MGLMGEIAATVYNGLGEESVIGVIPEALQPREVVFNLLSCIMNIMSSRSACGDCGISLRADQIFLVLQISGETVGEIRIVPDMHTRKVGLIYCSTAQTQHKLPLSRFIDRAAIFSVHAMHNN